MNKKSKTTPTVSASTMIETGPVADLHLVLKVPEFGSRYRVSQKTVYTWLQCGLPHMKLGHSSVRIPVKEADRWMAERFSRRHHRQ